MSTCASFLDSYNEKKIMFQLYDLRTDLYKKYGNGGPFNLAHADRVQERYSQILHGQWVGSGLFFSSADVYPSIVYLLSQQNINCKILITFAHGFPTIKHMHSEKHGDAYRLVVAVFEHAIFGMGAGDYFNPKTRRSLFIEINVLLGRTINC